MTFKSTPHRFPESNRPNPVLTCRICRSLQRHGARHPIRKGGLIRSALTRHQIVNAMYAYLRKSWEELPDENKRALGFDPAMVEAEKATLGLSAESSVSSTFMSPDK